MENRKRMTIISRGNSFKYALNGLLLLFKKEPNARIHLAATVTAIVVGIYRNIKPSQWALITIAIGIVWIAEAFNTAIETLSDLYCDNKFHPQVKIIKDVAASAVLVASLVSVIIAIIVFTF